MGTTKQLRFKGTEMNPGDVIRITPSRKLTDPRELNMVALGLLNEQGTVLLVLLSQIDARCNKDVMMCLEEHEIASVEVIMEAAEAVPQHSGAKKFQPSERIVFRHNGQAEGGKVIAAFEGIVAAELNSGEIEVGEFDRPPTSPLATTLSKETDVPA